jgi:HAD superfamily hydrolase (TIGR01490 family)
VSWRGAFFDVDETLVDTKTMFSFLRFHQMRRGERPGSYVEVLSAFQRATAGRSRADANRLYYRMYRGASVRELERTGRAWAEAVLDDDRLWLPARDHLLAFRDAGARTALLSGSFFACLDPLAERLGVDVARGSPVEIRRGALTGEIAEPMIGEGKATHLRHLLKEWGLSREITVAYGDHSSDLPMLQAAGHGVVVGDDPKMLAAAADHGWGHLPHPNPVHHQPREVA